MVDTTQTKDSEMMMVSVKLPRWQFKAAQDVLTDAGHPFAEKTSTVVGFAIRLLGTGTTVDVLVEADHVRHEHYLKSKAQRDVIRAAIEKMTPEQLESITRVVKTFDV